MFVVLCEVFVGLEMGCWFNCCDGTYSVDVLVAELEAAEATVWLGM